MAEAQSRIVPFKINKTGNNRRQKAKFGDCRGHNKNDIKRNTVKKSNSIGDRWRTLMRMIPGDAINLQ